MYVCLSVYVCMSVRVHTCMNMETYTHTHKHTLVGQFIAVAPSVQDPDPNDLTVHQYLDLLDTLEILHWVWRYLN